MKLLKLENIKLHCIFWAVFIFYEISISFTFGGKFSSIPDYAAHYLLNIGLFYTNAHIVFPTAMSSFTGKSYVKLALLVVAEIAAYLLLKFLVLTLLGAINVHISRPITTPWAFFVESVWRAIYFLGLSTSYWFALSKIRDRKTIADLENENLRSELQNQILEKTLLATENAYLKSQINPHFLLNTLNFLYNSVSKFSEKIADSVLLLSDIMRYALTNADEDGKVLLEAEIENIDSFIKLNQARFNQRLNITMDINGDPAGLRIIPLVLITLIENIFKYGDLLNAAYPAKINISIVANSLTFTAENKKRNVIYNHGYGIGIKNVESRLAMYYKYQLLIDDSDASYKSELRIEL